jgi:hypothetical protein
MRDIAEFDTTLIRTRKSIDCGQVNVPFKPVICNIGRVKKGPVYARVISGSVTGIGLRIRCRREYCRRTCDNQ